MTRTDDSADGEDYAAFTPFGEADVPMPDEEAMAEYDDISPNRRDEWIRRWRRFSGSALTVLGLGFILLVVFTALFAPFIAPHPDDAGAETNFDRALESPSADHPFGTDEVGRDILTRTMFGSQIALQLGLLVVGIAVGIGVPLGLVAGFYGGLLDSLIMRTSDVFLAIPPLVLVLSVTFAVGDHSLTTAIMAIAVVWWPWYARLVRGEVVSVREEQFVEASRAVGASRLRIAFREVLPNVVTPITVKGTLDMGFAILVGAALSFLGLGAQEPTPDWGTIVALGRDHLPEAWWLTVFPGLAIFITVLGFNLLGDGLRDVLDVEVDTPQ